MSEKLTGYEKLILALYEHDCIDIEKAPTELLEELAEAVRKARR